jgi:endonuclease YncB( thermonuclease family)
VAEVFANGRNVNLAMVQSGQAFAYRKYLSGCDQSSYLSAEQEAERRGLGVWMYPGAVQRPWEFRDIRRN